MPVVWKGDDVTKAVTAAAMRGLIKGGFKVKGEMIRRIKSPPKTGHTYRRRGIVHQASAPGEAPATDTGKLIGSISDPKPNFATLSVTINVSANYAASLEYGTQKMEPRPYARVSLNVTLPSVIQDVERAVSKAL